MPRRTRLLADMRPLRESPPFRRLWAGSLLSTVGGSMTAFAVMLQVYLLTRSAFAVGALGLVSLVPTLLVGMFGGSLADQLDRRKLVLVTSSLLATVSALFAVQAFVNLRQVWLLYVLEAVQAALVSIDAPARRTFVPRLLAADQLPAGLALTQVTTQVTFLVGPALAGLIAAAGGLRYCYLIDVLSFGAALYGVGRLPAMPPRDGAAKPGPRAVAEGIRFVLSSRPVAGAFLADLNAMVLGLPLALFPAINAERFGGDPRTLGLFTTAVGVGGLVASVLSGPLGRVQRPGRAMLMTVGTWGAAMAGFGLARGLWLTLGCLAAAGAADTTTVVLRGMIVQTAIPEQLRGRITAADYVVGSAGPALGNLESGAVGSLASPAISAVSGGLATVVGAIIIGFALPAFTHYQSRPSAAGAAADHGAGGNPGDAPGDGGPAPSPAAA